MRPYLRVANVFEDRIDTSDILWMNFTPEEFENYRLFSGDILLNEGQSLELVGRPAMFQGEVPDACFQNTLIRFQPHPGVFARYALGLFRYYLRSARFQSIAARSTNIAHLGVKRLAELEFPLPPSLEQQRIADKLDTLLARVEACRQRLERVTAILKRFREAVLEAAVSGELTREWREAGGHAETWSPTRIGEIAEVGTGLTPLRSNSAFYAGAGIPWVTSASTSQEKILSAPAYVTELAIRELRMKVYPAGTLLVAMYGEGKTRGQVSELGIPAAINQACAAVQVNNKSGQTGFVKLILQSKYLVMRSLAAGGAQPNLNLGKIRDLSVDLPPLAEQREIARRTARLFSCIEKLESSLHAGREALYLLPQLILSLAFEGRLVPQDPNDEPADKLLARIRDSRAKGTKAEPAAPPTAPPPAKRTRGPRRAGARRFP